MTATYPPVGIVNGQVVAWPNGYAPAPQRASNDPIEQARRRVQLEDRLMREAGFAPGPAASNTANEFAQLQAFAAIQAQWQRMMQGF